VFVRLGSRTQALLTGEYVEGTRVVETTVRPIRPACLIPEDDPGLAVRFAESRSLAWGGHTSFALPYSRADGLRQPWRQLLDLLDPDMVFALGAPREHFRSPWVVPISATSEQLAEQPAERPDEPLAYRLGDDLGRMVYETEGPQQLLVNASTLMHSALGAVAENLKPPDSEQFVVVPRLSRGPSAYLPLSARYGGISDSGLSDVLSQLYGRGHRFYLDLSKAVRVEEFDAAGDLVGVLGGDLSGLLAGDESERALTLPDLTLGGLVSRLTGAPNLRPMVITGKHDSVEDFALFWNLRSEHYYIMPFPMWIPSDLLVDARARASIEKALAQFRPTAVERPFGMDDLWIVSASMGPTELRERLGERYPEASIGTEDLIGLFTARSDYRYTAEKLPVFFESGRASIQPPRPGELENNLIPLVDHVTYEIGVDGMWMPQSKSMARHLAWPEFESRDRVSSRGNLRFVRTFKKELSERDLIELRTPDGWTLLRSVFEERGYDVAPTDKSRAALGQLALVGGVENIKVLASSKVRELLRELSIGRGEGNAFVSERRTAPLSRFDSKLGKESGRELLKWLIERRLLFRGAIIKCPRCEWGKWYEVDRVAETWQCDGCKEEMPIPLHLQSTPWRYRINELYAHGHDQGTLTPLLTLYAMHTAWGASSAYGNLGFYPGVELKAKDGADVPFQHKEIDLVAMRGGDLILVECKESVDHLSEHGEAAAFARQLGDLVVLADHLGASQVLAASSTPFPDDKETLIADVPSQRSVQITWLDSRDLLDPDFPLHPLRYPEVADRRIDRPEGWDTDYLDWVRRSITNQDV
jgi:hypothetical protein